MNLCQSIVRAAECYPDRTALSIPQPDGEYTMLSYRHFMRLAAHFQRQLLQTGLITGDRVVLMTPPGQYLYPLLVAMLGAGIVAVMPERGLPKAQFRAALRLCRPKGIITEANAGKFWPLFPELWSMKRFVIDRAVPGMKQLNVSFAPPDKVFICQSLPSDTTGLITFTSGTTGIPKGANRTHQSLTAQRLAIETCFPSQEQDIDLHSFPVLVLQTLSTGQHSVLPRFDFSRPGAVNPAEVSEQITQLGVTRISGAPAFMQKITRYAQEQQLSFPEVRQVVIGGAPGCKALYQGCLEAFPHAQHAVIYGSTEAEPIATVDIRSLTEQWSQHAGYLVGSSVSAAEICLRKIGGQQKCISFAPGEVGEILVAGPHVLSAYIDNPQATRQYKIPRPQGGVWHCTGDVGFFDDDGQIWLVGRVSDEITISPGRTVYPYPLEKLVNDLEETERSALIAHPQGGAALILQCTCLPQALPAILDEFQLADVTRIYQISEIPVDIRHNSKINRLKLRTLLEKNALTIFQLNRESL
ncbi:AMP-binding protein (plasmid) [Enterobacter sp. JS8-1]|uniref:AMP-binding protein n=1 Tax=Enterobacter sp. JS8-1 TaxID=3411633 RepID=UPI003BA3B83C